MKSMSFSETVFLFVLALIIFGPKKLPEIARQAGKLINEFRRASNEFKSQIEQEFAHIEGEKYRSTLPASTPLAGTASRVLRSLTPPTPAGLPVASPAENPTTGVHAGAVDSAADSNNEPLFASKAASSAEAPQSPASSSDPVTSSASQESHA